MYPEGTHFYLDRDISQKWIKVQAVQIFAYLSVIWMFINGLDNYTIAAVIICTKVMVWQYNFELFFHIVIVD